MRCSEPDCDDEASDGEFCLVHEKTSPGKMSLDRKRQRLEDRIAELELGVRRIRIMVTQGGYSPEVIVRICGELTRD